MPATDFRGGFRGQSGHASRTDPLVFGTHKLALARKRAAFDAATLQFPDQRLALRQGIMVLREHVPPGADEKARQALAAPGLFFSTTRLRF
jgi:hypothetical protein